MQSLCIIMVLISSSGAAGAPVTRRVPELVAQLGSTNYQEREAAFRALDELGQQSLDDLRSAVASPDSEIARRATELIRRIEQRMVAAERLAPTLVEVDIDNKSVVEAVTNLNKATGLTLAIRGDMSKLRERKLTFKTNGKEPVWQVLDQFLKAANLVEWDGITPTAGMPTPTVQSASGQFVQINRARIQIGGSMRSDSPPPKEIFLYHGQPSSSPTVQSGAVRIRILPMATPIPNVMPDADELVVPLQVTVEPKLIWQSHPTIKHAQAIDHRGQGLTASVIGSSMVRDPYEELGIVNALMFRDPSSMPNNPQRSQYLALRFRRGSDPAKTLKQLTGTLSLPFRFDGELLSLNTPAQSVGKTARAGIGASLSLVSAARTDTGDLKMELAIDLPNDVLPANFNAMQFSERAQWQGGMMGVQQTTTTVKNLNNSSEYMGVSIFDKDGKRLPLKSVRDETVTTSGDGMKIKMTLFGKLAKDAPDPARLAFRASYATSVESAFTFHDLLLQ